MSYYYYFLFRTIAGRAVRDARRNFPREEHGMAWPIYGDLPRANADADIDTNVTPLRLPTEARHG